MLQVIAGALERGITRLDLLEHLIEALDQLAYLILAAGRRRPHGIVLFERHHSRDARELENGFRDDPLQSRGDQQRSQKRCERNKQDNADVLLNALAERGHIGFEVNPTQLLALHLDFGAEADRVLSLNKSFGWKIGSFASGAFLPPAVARERLPILVVNDGLDDLR